MSGDGTTHFIEAGPGKVSQGLVKKMAPSRNRWSLKSLLEIII